MGWSGPGAQSPEEVVLAEVGEHRITLAEYRTHVDRIPDSLRSALEPRRYLQALIDEELLLQEAERWGLDRSPELEKQLRQEGRALAMRALYQRTGIAPSKILEAELRAYFARSPYSRRVRFSLLMVKTSEQILSLLEELKAGADFEELSMQHSRDSRILARKADMGYHRWGETMPPYDALVRKAFTMKSGEIAGPLAVADGYFLIKLTEIHPVSFAEERETIEQWVLQQRLGPPLRAYYDSLMKRYGLEYKPTGFKTLFDIVAVSPVPVAEPGAPAGQRGARRGGESARANPRGEGARVDVDSALPILNYKGGTLTLAQCLHLLRGSSIPREPEALRRRLDQQICQQVLMPLEIERLGLLQAPQVRKQLEQTRRRFLVRQLQSRIAAQAPPLSEDLLQRYFESNRERYLQPARVEARRMLAPDRASGEEIVDRLRAGRDTLSLVDRFVTTTYGNAALEEDSPIGRVLRAAEGSIHGPLAAQSGYIVLQVLRRYESGLPVLEEVRDQVAADLEQDRAASLVQTVVENLRTRYAEQINIYQERLQGLDLSHLDEERGDSR